MKGIWQRISAEPAAVTGAVMASINVIAAFRVWMPTPGQLAALNGALAAVCAVIVRAAVKPTRGPSGRARQTRPRQPQKRAAQPDEAMDERRVTAA